MPNRYLPPTYFVSSTTRNITKYVLQSAPNVPGITLYDRTKDDKHVENRFNIGTKRDFENFMFL